MKYPEFELRDRGPIHSASGEVIPPHVIHVGFRVRARYGSGSVFIEVTAANGNDAYAGVITHVMDADENVIQSLGDLQLAAGDEVAFSGRHVVVVRHQ